MKMKKLAIPFLAILLSSCYSTPNIPGFDQDVWMVPITYCDQSKIELAKVLIDNKDQLLGEGQTQIKQLLGMPSEQELYRRTEKFFYYNLTPGDTCDIQTIRRLSIRFDALDRAKEIMIIE
tara:strand:+ start:187 stop:549 length:363 start_codon:yes stop_codon:yes gene_type:complete